MKLSKILRRVDFSEQGAGAAQQAAALARHFGARLILLHVNPILVVRAAATRRNAGLVVIGRSPQEGVLGRLRPNANSMVHEAPCPVVSV